MNDRSRPKAAPETPAKWSDPSVAADTPQIAARRSWAYRLLRRCTEPPPVYGSAEWLTLPEGSPAKIGAVVRAAECWAVDGDDLPERLAAEVEASSQAFKVAEDADYFARYRAHRVEWSRRTPPGQSFSERRAKQLEAAKPRPGDFQGRGSA